MSLYDAFETNKNLEAEGVEIAINDSVFKVRAKTKNNQQYTSRVRDLMERKGALAKAGGVREDELAKEMLELFVDTLVVGWTGVKARDGSIMDYTRENAIKLFTDLPRLQQALEDEIDKVATWKSAKLEDDAKN